MLRGDLMKLRASLTLLCAALAASVAGCVFPKQYNLPPAERLMRPGPGVDGPGPGVLPPAMPPGFMPIPTAPVQVLFARPEAMQVRYDVGGVGLFDSEPIVVPGRSNFPEGGIYRLKITNISGREGVELYPTLEVGPVTSRSVAFVEHNAIPVQFTDEDIDQVLTGNFVTKVIYLPDPEFQVLAVPGVETLVSTRLDPGVDPIVEADRRGAILAIVRLGNKDLEGSAGAAGFDPGVMQAGFPMGMNQMGAAVGSGVPQAMGGYGAPGYGDPGYGPDCYGPQGAGGPVRLPPSYVAGVTSPDWGMPYVGTPIGLPGPAHIPFGGPAGLQTYSIKNRTHIHMPAPVHDFNVVVKQRPGLTYPKPANNVRIKEEMIHPANPIHNSNRFQRLH
jgi:hypothetical protein